MMLSLFRLANVVPLNLVLRHSVETRFSVAMVQNLFQTSNMECDENIETGGQIEVFKSCNLMLKVSYSDLLAQ